MTTKRKGYSKQFKIDAVKLVPEEGYKISEAARNLEIHPNVLQKWKQSVQLRGGNETAETSRLEDTLRGLVIGILPSCTDRVASV